MSGPLGRARLTIEADADGDGTPETGVFEMAGNLTVRPRLRTGFILNGRGSTVNSVIAGFLESRGADVEDPSRRRGFYLDLGGGQWTVDIEFRGWRGSRDEEGVPLQWGDDPSPSRSQSSATGQGPQTQIDVLMRYINVGQIDSRNTAILEYGEHSSDSDSLYDPVEVVLEGPQASRRAQESDGFDGRMTCIAAASFTDPWDASFNDER